ncbi:hypothetical protein P43SY_009541 [Pythium insidiosum]|uniref:2Fe-2S ferredoxin n=1 Tax=Pythium insidiosum TaxID=114742 RepID=A0AAD5Q7F4_PYTIN|nr:hypothetical protein P43SY_009541 [Pythium insidiosum]
MTVVNPQTDGLEGGPHEAELAAAGVQLSLATPCVQRRESGATRSVRRLSQSLRADDGFTAVFGVLGVAMVAAFVCSALTLLYLAVIQLFPIAAANALMNTRELDYGEFWLLSQASPPLVGLATAMLLVFSLAYLALALFMVFFRDYALPVSARKAQALKPREAANAPPVATASVRPQQVKPRRRSVPKLRRQSSVLRELVAHDGAYHAYFNMALDLPKLLFQTVSLVTYLSEGFPLPLIHFYATMLVLNWCISFARFLRDARDHRLVVTRLFYLFDLFFAVFAPIVVLAYAYHTFKMDREAFAVREDALSPGSFDRIARLFADPVQVDVFRFGFSHLQLTKLWYIVVKGALNLLALVKWRLIIVHLIRAHHKTVLQRKLGPKACAARDEQASSARAPANRFRVAFGVAVFVSSIAAIVSYTSISIHVSQRNCDTLPQCRVISYRVEHLHETTCPCIVFVDRDLAPKTFDAWMNPPDATTALALAAQSGHLRTVQIINRAVPELPESLRHCHEMEQLILIYTKTQALPEWVREFENMHHLILIYTKTQALPEWVREFENMHHLHVESNFIHYPLHTLPPTVFSNMKRLRLLRFGGAATLTEFPSLRGLEELTMLVFSIPRGLTRLPDFSDLHNLAMLVIADATHLQRLPSLEPLRRLKSFSLLRRNAVCCNGYIDGVCNLTDYQCMPRAGEAPVSCEAARISDADIAVIQRVNGFLCSKNLTSDLSESEPTSVSTDGLCQGVLYRKCSMNGQTGICYNGRMQVIHCDIFGEYERMRRLEIALNVGPPCDHAVEAWLGMNALTTLTLHAAKRTLPRVSLLRATRSFHASAAVAHGDLSKFANNPTVHLKFRKPDGAIVEVDAKKGMSILQVAHANDIDLEGACESSMACSTCHVILEDDVFDELEPACEDEEDMLDMAFGLTHTSRLGCQVFVDESMEGTTVTMPKATRNFYVDGHVPKPH